MGALTGCGSSSSGSGGNGSGDRDSTAKVLTPEAPGTVTYTGSNLTIDASNSSRGYVILNYTGSNDKVKFQVTSPDNTVCTYIVSATNTNLVYPLTGDDGTYTLTLYESVDASKDQYVMAYSKDISVTLDDEFLPFLYPNVYVDFDKDTKAVSKAVELATGASDDLDVITNVYDYVIENVKYDDEKAANVSANYVPDVDDTLSTNKGICFDYAALMTCMLRSQSIPTKLEVGYAGDLYHAWISCYVDEVGWVDNIIQFDGESWSIMDPTLAASNSSSDVKEYMEDSSKYVVKYTY
jgi:transglutaminase-like putative cysteine protease